MKEALLAVAVLALLTTPALADDIFAPVWRGEANTVFAEWDTWTGFNTTPSPFFPDTFTSEPAGLPSADGQAYDTAQYTTAYAGRTDVVMLDGYQQIDFVLPNFAGEAFTELWIQLTYWATNPTDVVTLIDTDPYTSNINGPMAQGMFDHADGWVTEAYSFTIQPSVNSELIALEFGATPTAPVYLDHIVLESVAAPEPTGLVCVALLLVLARRR